MSPGIFEKASRRKLRFETPNGLLTVDDLWDLPLTSKTKVSLDALACSVYKRIEQSEKMSFVAEAKPADADAILALDILKRVIAVKQEEAEAAARRRAANKQAEKIMEIIERKEDQKLEGATVEELRAQLKELTAAS